jgi:hypothetical protein
MKYRKIVENRHRWIVHAQGIAGDPDLIELARRIAEAEVDVLRVRRFRTAMTS